MSLSCSFNIKVENITDIIGKDTFKNLTQEECESVVTQLMSSYNLTQEALLDNKYKSDIIAAIKRGREEASKAALANIETEMQQILENAPRDSEGNLLAPNGKKSNLTERQYAQVRTKAFKDWFGDWENANKENPYSKDISIGSPEADFSNVDSTGTGVLIPIFLNGEYIGETGLDNALYHKDKGMSIKGKYMEMPSVGGSNITIEKEYRGKGYGKATYFELAKLAANNGKILRSAPDKSRTPASTRVWESLVRDGYAKRVNDRYEIINSTLNNASKVVDENGEPLVVYHYTDNEGLTKFSTEFDNYFSKTGGTKKAIFFTTDNVVPGSEDNFLTSRKAKLSLFLNIKNLETFNGTKDDLHKQGASYREVVNKSSEREGSENGIVFTGFDDNRKENQTIYIVHNSNQIKSATDNIGAFSRTNDRIDYFETNNSEKVVESQEALDVLKKEGITLDNSLIDKYLLEIKASNPYHQIFKQIVGILNNNNIPINIVVNSNLSNIAARKQDGFKTATIEINPALLLDYLMTDNKDNIKENLMKILTHELVHAVTAEILNYHPSWAKIKNFNEAQTEFSNNVWNLYLQCKEQLKETKWYGLTNAKEFIAVALTDRDFQIELSKIKLDKNENAFKRFINYLTNLFNKVFKAQGIDIKNSALEEIISISQEYFNSANKNLRGGIYDYTGTRDYYEDNESFTWDRTSNNSYEVSSRGDARFSALNAKFNKGTIIDGVDVGGMTIEDVYQSVIKKSRKGQAPSKDSKLFIDTAPKLRGKMVFAFEGQKADGVTADTTLEAIKRGERTATTRFTSDGNINYWKQAKIGDVIEFSGQNGEKILVRVTKELHQLPRIEQGTRKEALSEDTVEGTSFFIEENGSYFWHGPYGKLVELTKQQFEEGVKNGVVIIRLTSDGKNAEVEYAKEWSAKEGWDTNWFYTRVKPKIDKGEAYQMEFKYIGQSKEAMEDFSYTEGYLPLWQEWARQNPELIEELREKAKGKTLTDRFANTRVSQARALADILNNSTKENKDFKISISIEGYRKGDPQKNPNINYVFTENAQAYVWATHNDDFAADVAEYIKPKLNVSDVNGTNQAGIRTDIKGNISPNAYGIVVKKYQQDANGKFVAKEGQFQDTDEDFNLFTALNKDMFKRLSESSNKEIKFPSQMALGKAALPLRFAKWLQNELSTRFGIGSTIEKNTKAGYEGYGLKLGIKQSEEKNTTSVTKIISGGQTGVDTIGLQVAKELGIETGGKAPKGFLREEGYDNEDIASYGLEEITDEEQADYTKRTSKTDPYTGRTELNVRNSDGTVYFHVGSDTAGLIATRRSAKEWNKPFIENPTAEELRQWIKDNNIKTLNVAGNRGTKLAKDNKVAATLKEALTGISAANVIKESEYSKQLIKILQSLVDKIKASNIKEAKAAQNLYEWTIKAQQAILDAIERGERKDEDLSLDKVQEHLNNLIQNTPENLAEGAIKAAKEMSKDWGKSTEQKSKKETKKSDKTLKETIESAKAKRPTFDSVETGKIQKRLLSIYFPNVTERLAAINFISDYFSIMLDKSVEQLKDAISEDEDTAIEALGEDEYRRIYKGLFTGTSAQQRVFALSLDVNKGPVPLQIFSNIKIVIDDFKDKDIKTLVYKYYLNKDNTVKMDSFLGNEFSWEASQNGWDKPKKLEEMATLRVRAMKSYFTKHFGDDRVFDALVKEAAFDIEFNENIRLDTRGNIMENNQEREDKENDVENEEENPNKEGYMIKYKLLDPIDTISVKLKNKLAHLYKMNFNLKRNNDVEYVFNSLGMRVKLNPMIAYYTILNEFQSISSEDELDGMFEDAVAKYPWLQSLKDNVVFNPLVPQEFDIDFRKEFFRACKSFAPFAMVTKDGTIAYLNRDNQSATFLDMVKTSYEGHNVLGENSIFNEDGTRNSGNVETIFYLLTSGERKDKEGKKKKDDVNRHPFFLVKNILKKNKASVFELFTALQILRGEHPEYKSIKVNNVIYKDISLEGLLKNLGIETANMNLEALIPATFALEVDDEGNTTGSKESPEFTDDFIDEAEANGYSNPVDYFNSLFTPKMRRYLSTILEKATVITRPKQGYQNGDNLVLKFQNSYLSIGNALTMANEAYSQTSFRFNNNTRFSYTAYDMITRMSNLLSKTSTDEAIARGTKYLEDNYGQYDFFRDQKTKEWNNVWLQQWFEQDEHGEYTIRNNFKILNMLGFGGNEDKDSFGKVSSETLMDSHILAFLNGNKDKWGNEYGYYRNALFSDTDASVLVKQIRYTGDNYKEVIINNLAKVLRQEIERIISVMKSSEDPNTIKIEYYNEGKKNGQKFNFFPALNAKEKYIQVLTEYNRLSQLNSAEFKEQSDKFLADLVTDVIEGEVDPITGLRTGGKLQEFLNSIDETRRKSLYRKILKINATKEKSEESEEDENSTKKLLGEVFGDEEENTKENTKKTSEEQSRELDEILTNFFYNDYFAQSQIIQIFGGDLAYYKNFRDFIKRNKQAYAAGDRLYGMLMDEQGNNIEPLTETAIYVEDKIELSNTYDSIKQLLNSAVGVSEMSRDMILGALDSYKDICATDGQSFRTPESIKKILQAMGGKWTDDMEEAFNRMTIEGKLDIKDFYTIWNNIKPFLYSHETVQVGDRREKVVTQHKNSEYMMTAMYSMITSALSNSPQLKALQKFMKKKGIDVVHFHSVVKEGYFSGVNINYSIERFNKKKGENDYIEVAGNKINADTYEDFRDNLIQALDDEKITQEDYNQAIRDIDFERSKKGVDDCYKQLEEAIATKDEDGNPVLDEKGDYVVDETYLHKFPLSDYMVVQPSGDHLTEDDLVAIFGSQLRNIIPADLPESFIAKVKLGNKNKEFTRDEYIKLYNTLIVDQLLDSFARVSDEFSSVEKLQSVLLAKIHGNPKYGSDVEEALQLEDAGNGNKRFKIPFNNPNLNNKIEELILSTFKNAIQKQKINGGNIILVSNFGLSDNLHVQYKTDENGNKYIDYIPCYMPAYKRSLIQDFLIPRRDSKTGEEWWEVDYEKMKGNEDLLEMIGYRI